MLSTAWMMRIGVGGSTRARILPAAAAPATSPLKADSFACPVIGGKEPPPQAIQLT